MDNLSFRGLTLQSNIVLTLAMYRALRSNLAPPIDNAMPDLQLSMSPSSVHHKSQQRVRVLLFVAKKMLLFSLENSISISRIFDKQAGVVGGSK